MGWDDGYTEDDLNALAEEMGVDPEQAQAMHEDPEFHDALMQFLEAFRGPGVGEARGGVTDVDPGFQKKAASQGEGAGAGMGAGMMGGGGMPKMLGGMMGGSGGGMGKMLQGFADWKYGGEQPGDMELSLSGGGAGGQPMPYNERFLRPSGRVMDQTNPMVGPAVPPGTGMNSAPATAGPSVPPSVGMRPYSTGGLVDPQGLMPGQYSQAGLDANMPRLSPVSPQMSGGGAAPELSGVGAARAFGQPRTAAGLGGARGDFGFRMPQMEAGPAEAGVPAALAEGQTAGRIADLLRTPVSSSQEAYKKEHPHLLALRRHFRPNLVDAEFARQDAMERNRRYEEVGNLEHLLKLQHTQEDRNLGMRRLEAEAPQSLDQRFATLKGFLEKHGVPLDPKQEQEFSRWFTGTTGAYYQEPEIPDELYQRLTPEQKVAVDIERAYRGRGGVGTARQGARTGLYGGYPTPRDLDRQNTGFYNREVGGIKDVKAIQKDIDAAEYGTTKYDMYGQPIPVKGLKAAAQDFVTAKDEATRQAALPVLQQSYAAWAAAWRALQERVYALAEQQILTLKQGHGGDEKAAKDDFARRHEQAAAILNFQIPTLQQYLEKLGKAAPAAAPAAQPGATGYQRSPGLDAILGKGGGGSSAAGAAQP